jgi:ATP-dependent RNA helicase RhlE
MATSFNDFALNKQLLTAVEEMGYSKPTPIQEKAIPLLLYGHDLLGIAQTGTGKTAAFLLPILMKIKYAQGDNIRCLILAPTRELAIQINDAIADLGKYTDIRHTAIYGGLGPKTQIENIQKGLDIIVATPGRFMDLYLKGIIVTKEIKYMVMDEADKMMDMGFMPQIRKILEVIPRKRKNLLFSATFPEKVEKLSSEFLESPLRVEVTPQATAAKTIDQQLYAVPNFQTKLNLLSFLIKDSDTIKRALVFCRTKTAADLVFKFLERKVVGKMNIRVIHANKGQNTRINSINAFKSGELRILVSTDVAARGIDVYEVSHVINFDVPVIYEDYVHRIGRTGRANHDGVAITFMTPNEVYHIDKIEGIIRTKITQYPIPQEVLIEETPFEEEQIILREIDEQRKKADPTFQGAFHEKKAKNLPREAKKKKRRPKGKRR